jgi:cbb3-type cytochrome oxidase subunit 3
MKADILSLTDFAFLAQISTLIFVGVFLGAIYWMFRPGAKQAYESRARMPLDDVNPIESPDP